MTFPVVASVTQSSEGASVTNPTIDLPATVAAGDLLIACVSQDGASTWTWPAGWTELLDGTFGTHSLSVAYRIADGTEGGGNVSPTATVAERCTQFCMRITGWHGTTPPEAAALVTGATATPDPPSVTASWGSDDNLFIAIWSADGGWPTTGYPANYTHTQHESTATPTSAGYYGVASRQLAAATDNPGTAAITASDQWQATTIVVRPAAAGSSAALAGTAAGVSTVGGDLTANPAAALAGLIAGVSGASGDLTPIQAHWLAGVIAGVSGVSGGLLLDLPPQNPIFPASPFTFIEIWAPVAGSARWDNSTWDNAEWTEYDWVNIADKVQNAKFGWGADDASNGILTQVAADAATLFTYDPDRELDPSNDLAPLHSALRPGNRMRIRWTDGVEGYYLKTGVIDNIVYSIQSQRGQIRLVDRVAQMANAKVPAGLTGVPTTLRAAARYILAIAGLDEFITVPEPDPPIADPTVAGAIAEEATVWDWMNTLALDALCGVWLTPDDSTESGADWLLFPSFQTVNTTSVIIGGALGIPIEDVAPESALAGVYSQVIAFDDSAPTTPILVQSDDAVNKFGKVPFKRDRVHPDAGAWASFVLADRSGANLQYQMGVVRPTTAEQFNDLALLRMLDEVQLKASSRDNGQDPIENPINVFVRVLGIKWEANTESGMSARIIAYVATPNWT